MVGCPYADVTHSSTNRAYTYTTESNFRKSYLVPMMKLGIPIPNIYLFIYLFIYLARQVQLHLWHHAEG